eukprot:12697569-Alexandrium_andersonii.AAC.1
MSGPIRPDLTSRPRLHRNGGHKVVEHGLGFSKPQWSLAVCGLSRRIAANIAPDMCDPSSIGTRPRA